MEKKRGSREIEVTKRRRGESKGERAIQPVIISLSDLHNLESSEKFTALHREKKQEGGDRDHLGEKKKNPKGESRQASNLAPK